MDRLRKRFMDCTGLSMEECESYGKGLAELQRDIMFHCGDLARYAESKWPETHQQIWPEWVSPGMLSRAAGVCKAYPKEEDRQHELTYTQFMQVAGRPNRLELLAGMIGQTSDESRKAQQQERAVDRSRWIVAFDLHYIAHRHFYSGAGVETAMQVAEWVQRTAERLKDKGATDILCAFEGPNNFRKKLTEEWEQPYKGNRGPKPHDLLQQLQLVRELLERFGFCCASVDGHEADDVLASAAAQFPGKVTIVSGDKDLNQCLSDRVNILRDVEWIQFDNSADIMPHYKWFTAKMLFEETGLNPREFAEAQILSGDSVDSIAGVSGIGVKGAADLIKEFGTASEAIEAAKAEHESIKPKKREALIEFENRLEITKRLVTLVASLPIPSTTRI